MKRKNFIFVFAAVMALGFMSCNNDGKDIVVKETDYAEVFLNTFEEKLSLLFQTAERDLRSGNRNLELLFKNAYVEALGSYADVSTFENAFWSASNMAYSVQARSKSADEQLFVDLIHEVIDSSETKKEAIGKFDALANDASFDLEDRIGFIGMREFLIFYENNEELIILAILEEISDDLDEVVINELSGRRLWRCVLGTYSYQAAYGVGFCVGVGGFLFFVGGPPGALIGCVVGGVGGSVVGIARGIATFCLEEVPHIITNPEDETEQVIVGGNPELAGDVP